MNRRARSINHRVGTLRFAHPTLASAGNFSYLWFLYAAIVYFIGGSVALALVGRWGGMISMIAAPAFAVATVFFKL